MHRQGCLVRNIFQVERFVVSPSSTTLCLAARKSDCTVVKCNALVCSVVFFGSGGGCHHRVAEATFPTLAVQVDIVGRSNGGVCFNFIDEPGGPHTPMKAGNGKHMGVVAVDVVQATRTELPIRHL